MTPRSSAVCAILVNFHGADEVASAVASLSGQAAVARILVVDNSCDAVEFARLESRVGASATLLRAPSNLGFGQACNWAFEATSEPFVLLVNPDVSMEAGTVDLLLSAMSDARVAAAAPRQYLDDAHQWLLPPAWAPSVLGAWTYASALASHHARQRLQRALRREAMRYWTSRVDLPQRALSGGLMMLRRKALIEQPHLFDPRFFMYFEDADLCLRLRRAGHRLVLVPDARAVHAWRDAPHKAQQMGQSVAVFFDKYWPEPNRWRLATSAMLQRPRLLETWQSLDAPPDSEIQTALADGAVLEISPDLLFLPSIAHLGSLASAPSLTFPWERFGHGDVYLRLCRSDQDAPNRVFRRSSRAEGVQWSRCQLADNTGLSGEGVNLSPIQGSIQA